MPQYPKPAEGSWTEHYPELGTGLVSYEDCDLAGVLRARARGGLRAGVAQRRPGRGRAAQRQLLHQGARGREHLDHRRARPARDRSARSTTSAGTAATSWCGTTSRGEETSGIVPRSSRASTTAGATTSTGACTFVQQESEFFDLDKADYGARAGALRRVGGLRLRQPRRRSRAQSLREFLGPMVTAPRRATRSTG